MNYVYEHNYLNGYGFHIRNHETRRQRNNFNVINEKQQQKQNLSTRILYPMKISFMNEGEVKI